MGDTAWTLEWGLVIDPEVNLRCLDLASRIQSWQLEQGIEGLVDVIPTFRSVTVHFDPLVLNAQTLADQLLALAASAQAVPTAGRQWRLPVHFGAEHGPDLDELAERVKLTSDTCVRTLCDTVLRVYAMGFMPGFAYMATLPPSLHVPRRATPRTRVAPQTLAIANGMAGIYPWPSPGGWYLLGHMPVPLFDSRLDDQAALFCAGDALQFYPVDANTCDDLTRELAHDPDVRWRFLEHAS